MEEIVLKSRIKSTFRIYIYLILILATSYFTFLSYSGDLLDPGFIIGFIVTIFLLGLFLEVLTNRFKKLTLLEDGILVSSIRGTDSLKFSEINSLKVEFGQVIDGFNRMRLIAPFGKVKHKTFFRFEIDMAEVIFYDTLMGIDHDDAEKFLHKTASYSEITPKINQVNNPENYSTLFVFNFQEKTKIVQ